MKVCLSILFLAFAVLSSLPARAELDSALDYGRRIQLVRIESDFYPKEFYTMGFYLDESKSKKVGIYYSDTFKTKPEETSQQLVMIPFDKDAFGNLLESFGNHVLIHQNDRDVVELAYENSKMNITYRKNAYHKIPPADGWGSQIYTVDCHGSEKVCSIHDDKSNKDTGSIFIKATRIPLIRIPVGISAIESR